MIDIHLYSKTGAFAEDKDKARDIRTEEIIPQIESGNIVVLDFANIETTTQSFIHALISDLIRNYGNDILDKIHFKNCNPNIKKIITIVIEYMQEAS